MKLQITLALTLLTLASACDDDSFSQVVDIPFPEHEPLPALTVDMRSGDTAVYARLALSRGILDDPQVTDRSAKIEVYRGEGLYLEQSYSLQNTDGNDLRVPLPASGPDTIPAGPEEYRVVATIEGFAPAEATQRMPAPADFTLVSFEPNGALDSEGSRVDVINIDLTDPPGTEDFYGFRVLIPQQRCEFDTEGDSLICENFYEFANEAFMDSQDPVFKNSIGYGLVVTDQSFNGSTYRVRLLVDAFRDGETRLEVYRLTEDAYRYSVSREAYEVSGDNPFAEPVNIHNNVAGGYGYFVAASRRILALE